MTSEPSRQLAILGGTPLFERRLHVGRPNVGDRAALVRRFEAILDSRWFTNHGPLVRELEARIAELLGVRHCVAMCNGTIALQIAVQAARLEGEVIVPSFTFVATAHALRWQGLTPVFCDVAPGSHNLDPARVEKLITPRTSAILGVHVWGAPCDVEALEEIAERRGLRLMFDAAHAFGCSHAGRMIGGFGDAEVFSFHATKFVSCFEGGAVTTDDDELAQRMSRMRNFGFAAVDEVVDLGTNAKMTEICAAMGLTSIEAMDGFVAANRANHERYRRELLDLPGITLLDHATEERSNFQYVVVEVDEAQAGVDRDLLVRVLHEENVLARRYFYPGCHEMEPYRSDPGCVRAPLPLTETLSRRVMTLPTGTDLGAEEVSGICALIREAVERADDIRDRLASGPATS